MGLYFNSRTESIGSALLIYIFVAIIHAVLGVIVITGVVQDPGLFPVVDTPVFTQVTALVLLEGIYLMTYVIGRWTRKTTMDGIEDLQRAMRKVGQRDAQLLEARADLDRGPCESEGPGGTPTRSSDRTRSASSSAAAPWARSTRRFTQRPAMSRPSS